MSLPLDLVTEVITSGRGAAARVTRVASTGQLVGVEIWVALDPDAGLAGPLSSTAVILPEYYQVGPFSMEGQANGQEEQ